MKKKLFLLSAIPLVMGSLTGCGEDNRIKVGIMTIGFPAVAVAADGFLAELSAAGIAYNALTRIPSNDASAASIALDLASQCDYLLGVGTGNSQKLKGAIEEKGKAATSTLFFTAVTDPVDAGLVSSWDNPSGFVCGTSDMNPVAEQIDLIKECIPTVDKVGIFYTNSESNSRVQKDKAVTRLNELGITAVYDTCTNSADITTALSSFLQANPDMDALYIPTDNNIANNPGAVKTAIAGKGVLVVCGEGLSLKDCGGCVTKSVDYELIGRKCGQMAVSIMKGEKKAKDFPVEYLSADECEFVMSLANAAECGVSIPQSVQEKCRNLDSQA